MEMELTEPRCLFILRMDSDIDVAVLFQVIEKNDISLESILEIVHRYGVKALGKNRFCVKFHISASRVVHLPPIVDIIQDIASYVINCTVLAVG